MSTTVPAPSISTTGAQGTLLVRMIKPNLIHSHNWHVQPSSQRSVRAFRLSGALLDRGPSCYARGVLELDAHGQNRTFKCPRPFLRELSKPIELLAPCQIPFFVSSVSYRGRTNSMLAVVPQCGEPNKVDPQVVPNQLSFAQRKTFKQRPALLEPLRLAEDFPRVLQWLVL